MYHWLTFPFIEERVKAGKLHIHGMHYDFIEGKLTSWKVTPEEPGSPFSSNSQTASAKAS